MLRTFGLLVCVVLVANAFVTGAESASGEAVGALSQWLKVPREKRGEMDAQGFAKVALTKADAAAVRDVLWADHVAWIQATRQAEMAAKVIELDGKKMKFEMLTFGDAKKEGGRSLFISMHGGGGAPAPVNEQQWQNQIKLGGAYKPTEGIYVAPRAPTDNWNLWHEAHIDAFFARIVENLVVLGNVNPNRVYIMGYSAGGDGTYQLAPRMADWWAAAAMMAGHPNETQPQGLRNVPFALQVGGNDGAYDRNKIAGEWGKKLDDLQKLDPKGYAHMVEVHAGKGHWMDLEDKKAIPWMEKFTRNPLPEKIVWRQDDVTHARSYWLAVAKESAKGGDEIVATREGQTITVSAKSGTRVTVLLNDAMMDLDQPLVVKAGEKSLEQRVTRTIGAAYRTLKERGDRELVFSAEVEVLVP